MSSYETPNGYSWNVPALTPDGRYDVVRGNLCRRSNPGLTPDQRAALVARLRDAEQRIQTNTDNYLAVREAKTIAARTLVELGERGPVWWRDGAPDLHGQPIKQSPYGKWWDDHQRAQVSS